MVNESKAYRYASWCLEEGNRKVPKYVKKQADAWVKIVDGEDDEAYIDDQEFNKIERLLRVITHPDLGCSMYDGMEDYAALLIFAVFCTKDRRKEGIRYYQTAVLEIARKNFKTFYAAIIFILLMLIEPRFSRFFSVAPDLRLSSELKEALRKIIKSSPALYDDEEPAFRILRSEIECLITESKYTPLAYSRDRMDAALANAFLADEAGAMDAYPVEAMRSSQITLLNKLGIIISTQYPNDNNVMLEEIDRSKKVLDGVLDDRRVFSLLYEPDDDLLQNEEWKHNDLVIYQSNPVAVTNENVFQAIKDKRTLAVIYENKRENYLCKHNNIQYKGLGTEGYVDIEKVKKCKIKENLAFWEGKRVWIGLDLSQTEDNTSVSMVTESHGNIYAKVWGFIPEDRIELKSQREGVDYKKLIKDGVCFSCGNEVIDYSSIESFIMNLEEKYGVEIIQIGYDRYNAISTVQKLEAVGYECVDIKQHSSVLHPATKLLKEKILNGTFFYDENKMLEINFQNARCTEDTNLNKYVNKKRSAGKVDMVVSTINGIYLVQQEIWFGEDDFVVQVG